jgi:calcineurin-like phosphoesterase family protein
MSQQIWFTADTHLGHSRIIDYCKRPFQNHEEMEEEILQRFNFCIKKGDLLYHLGDVAWSSYYLPAFTQKLNTKAIYLVRGNHDKQHENNYKAAGFIWVKDLAKITVGSVPVVMCHYPMRSWVSKGYGAIHIYGHVHGTLPGHDRSLDVGVDPQRFYPISFDELYERTKNIPMFQDGDRESHRRDREE